MLHCLEVNPAERYPTAGQVGFELRNLNQVKLTGRAAKVEAASFWSSLKRKFNQNSIEVVRRNSMATQIAAAPIVMIAIDLNDGSLDLADALQWQALQILGAIPDARIACVNVLKLSRVALDHTLDESGHNKHLDRLARLKDWARPLHITGERITYHVLEAMDPAQSILEFANANHVDHIVMGARANSTSRKFLGSVSAIVASRAPCTVTVVRNRDSSSPKSH